MAGEIKKAKWELCFISPPSHVRVYSTNGEGGWGSFDTPQDKSNSIASRVNEPREREARKMRCGILCGHEVTGFAVTYAQTHFGNKSNNKVHQLTRVTTTCYLFSEKFGYYKSRENFEQPIQNKIEKLKNRSRSNKWKAG